jgi:transglutaminase-like putative cysteine protease
MVRESITEVRMQPRTEVNQRCLSFDLEVKPKAVVLQYRDFLGNAVHHFDIAASHSELRIKASSTVEVLPVPEPPLLQAGSWSDLDALVARGDYWEMLLPSGFAGPTPLLEELASELKLERRETPLAMLLDISKSIHELFSYVPNSTNVDSPIDHALNERKGVCQDFAHIMIALVRKLRMPCRYVSGYLFQARTDPAREPEGASHAWVEALVPGHGWVGFDPTNAVLSGERHIRVAIGRDYSEVPPTRGIYKGGAESELSVSVTVALADDARPDEDLARTKVLRRAPVPLTSASVEQDEQAQQ